LEFLFRLFPGTIRSRQVVEFLLTHLLRHLPGRIVRDFVASQNGRLTLEFLPGYAPELNPVDTCGVTGSSLNCRTCVPKTSGVERARTPSPATHAPTSSTRKGFLEKRNCF
jgi:hypothetical protein